MLNFAKILSQIEQVGADSLLDSTSAQTLTNATAAFNAACNNSKLFENKLVDNSKLVLWPVALPLEKADTTVSIKKAYAPISVVGVDGSQIMPSHHEVHNCFLLNIGIASISYGVPISPKLESVPYLYHKADDLYPLVNRRRIHIDELYISLERNLLELTTLAQIAIEAKEHGLPVIALLDGSLIPWSVERMPEHYQNSYLQKFVYSLDLFKQNSVPLVAYLSHSRSSDLVNALRVFICPYEKSNCRELCGHLNEEDFPCSKIWPLTDRRLLADWLPHNHRSCVFLSGANINKSIKEEQRTCFTYLHIGKEVARLEFPRWLFDNNELLKLAMSTVLAQTEKGMGYPLCLAEAHHLAVIKGGDREKFFALMAKHLVNLGIKQVSVSPKESKKRIGFV